MDLGRKLSKMIDDKVLYIYGLYWKEGRRRE
jgi:hypothetical protein